ncbi:hypothetical protein [Pseudomonas sp. PP3]|uniref:hypothetical protein n=1 Tax=Pseudomonas sp. PP3 TaxID=2815936 RepID=UPI001BB0CFB8|nr:hypothetical protein [Pseudomonas sp. PP3]
MKRVDLSGVDPDFETDSEKIHRLARIGLSSIPVVGSPLVEVFNSVLESPLSKRRNEIIIQIGEVLNELIESGVVTEEALRENEVFISTVAQSCSIALRNHESEKIEALKNAIKNAATPDNSAGDYSPMFLGFVDSCTTAHIQLLHVFHNPEKWFIDRGMEFPITGSKGRMHSIAAAAFPAFEKEYDFYENVWGDLCRRGFAFNNGFEDTLEREAILTRLTTPLGFRLIRFLT